MFYGLLGSIFNSLGDILYKKALLISKRYIPDSVYQFIGYAFLSISLLIILLVVEGRISAIGLLIFCLLIINGGVNVICEYLEQYAFRNEKISILTPYGELETIFASILGFIIFSNNSLITFISALIAGGVLILGSINFKKMKINRYCISLSIAGLLTSLRYIIFGYILLSLGELTTVFYSIFASFIIITLIAIGKGEIGLIKKSPLKLTKYIFAEGFFWIISVLITMYLIKEEGVVEAVLFSMSYLGVNLILSYAAFKDIPAKKEVISIIIVFGCMIVGYIYG